jgi:hypothetical protein
MSRSTLLRVYKSKAVWDEDLSNSWGSAPPLWEWLCNKYGIVKPGEFYFMLPSLTPLWKLVDRKDIPISQRLALFLTFDRAVILKRHLPEAAKHLRAFADFFWVKPGHVNHWPRIAEWVAETSKIKDSRLIGVGLNCTSVADVWCGYPKGEEIITTKGLLP